MLSRHIAGPANTQSVTLESTLPAFVIQDFLSNFRMTILTQISDRVNSRMEGLLRRVRSSSLRKRASARQNAENLDASESTIADASKEISQVENDQIPTVMTLSDAYGSVFSFTDGSNASGPKKEAKPSSRRSSFSLSNRKSSDKHVDFEPNEAAETTPLGVYSPPQHAAIKNSKKHRLRGMHSLSSLLSNATSTKSQRSLRKQRSVSTIRKTAAWRAVEDNFPKSKPAYVAIGSGSAMLDVVESISQLPKETIAGVTFITTGVASEHLLAAYKLYPITPPRLLPPTQMIDVYFDTADEVDDSLNCIRGRTGNLHLERMVSLRSESFICIADYHKRVPTLFSSGKLLAIEVTPDSYFHVIRKLRELGATALLRSGESANSGPYVTERGTYLIDASWPALENASEAVEKLAVMINGLYGVVDHGLFYAYEDQWNGRPTKVYIGLEDGAVDTLE